MNNKAKLQKIIESIKILYRESPQDLRIIAGVIIAGDSKTNQNLIQKSVK